MRRGLLTSCEEGMLVPQALSYLVLRRHHSQCCWRELFVVYVQSSRLSCMDMTWRSMN